MATCVKKICVLQIYIYIFYTLAQANFDFILFQITSECPTDLKSLSLSDNKTLINETTGNIDLEHAYKAAILFSAHFRYMAEDWSIGRTCLDADLNMRMNEAYERFVLYYLY